MSSDRPEIRADVAWPQNSSGCDIAHERECGGVGGAPCRDRQLVAGLHPDAIDGFRDLLVRHGQSRGLKVPSKGAEDVAVRNRVRREGVSISLGVVGIPAELL